MEMWKNLLCIIGIGFALFFVLWAYSTVTTCNNSTGHKWNSLWGYCEETSDSMWSKGMFGINDIYNTCLYVSQNEGLRFDGYCYKELPSKDRALESCVTGCKLGVQFKEDENVCFDRCQRYLINKE